MLKINSVILAVAIAVSVTACSTTSQRTTTSAEVSKVYIPDGLTASVPVQKFMPKEQYTALSPNDKEVALTEYIVVLYGVIKKYEVRLENIRSLNSPIVKKESIVGESK
jgi:hypothetical protein